MTAAVGPASWGRYPKARHEVVVLRDRSGALPSGTRPMLPYGNGRSYGDVCLNDDGVLLHTRGLDRFIAFDAETGRLACEAGVLLSEILDLVVPRGWFLPVTPGTKFVTIGGAIANDVHGKNHHGAGTFGGHVLRFELLRSDGSRLRCGPDENADWFRASVGGLGLTGLITWAEIQLRRTTTPWIVQESVRFPSLDGFFDIARESDGRYEYTVAWIDCLATGSALGRGVFHRGNHAPAGTARPKRESSRKLSVPFTPPISLVNRLTLRAFNPLYYRRAPERPVPVVAPYDACFYPLDGIGEWNRLYGPKGFLQYQCVVPTDTGPATMREILSRIGRSGRGSFLSVLKVFGDRPSPGMMSFPRPGVTLALDFPNGDAETFALLDGLDEVVAGVGGAVYPAKDARMQGARFRAFFPQWEAFSPFIDPKFSSSFWRRVTE